MKLEGVGDMKGSLEIMLIPSKQFILDMKDGSLLILFQKVIRDC